MRTPIVLSMLLFGACAGRSGETAQAPEPYYNDEVPPPAIRIVPEEPKMATGARAVEMEVEPIDESSAVVAQPDREPIGGFNLCGQSCAMDPRWTAGGKSLPDEE